MKLCIINMIAWLFSSVSKRFGLVKKLFLKRMIRLSKINFKIAASAKYVPAMKVSNDDLTRLVETDDAWIHSRTGIKTRYISTGENTSDLCACVASALIEKAGISPLEVNAVIVSTVTPDYLTPSTACIVQGKIGASNAFAFDVNAACAGFVYALDVGSRFVETGKYTMIISGDVLSKITDWADRATCVLFGDGAGGILITQTEEERGMIASELQADGAGYGIITGGHMPVANAFTEQNDSKRFEPFVLMQGRGVNDFVRRDVTKSIDVVLQKAGLTVQDIKYIVPHQANARLIEVLAKKTGVPIDKFYINIEEYANTSSSSIPIALDEMYEKGIIKNGSGDILLFSGFGAGFVLGNAVVRI